jgi:DNA-binding CsgD family transcriptional regulator/tetratricopeptide (TPR) repeat protein
MSSPPVGRWSRPVVAATIHVMAVATRWPFVGRHDELEAFAAALADEGCEAFCIYGAPGVGKTRLADECAARAESAGRRVLRITADRSTEAVPLAAIAHLLPAGSLAELGEGDVRDAVVRARLLHAALGLLSEHTAAAGVPVLVLDDVHRLDASSLTIVDHLLALGAVFGVATIVGGELAPETVTRWWRDERAVRLELSELDELGVDTLLHVVLEGPLEASASAELWDASHGNALALRELVLGALSRDTLVRTDGPWRLIGPIGATTRMHELVRARIGELTDTARSALEPLALCGPLGLSELEAAFGLATLEELERDGLIAVQADGRREIVRLAHPMHGEVLKEGLSELRSRSILLAHANAVEACGGRRRDDPIRIATWRLEATGRADPALLLRAARLARFGGDHRRAASLARAARAGQPTAAAGLVLGESLYDLSAFDQAEQVLAEAVQLAASDPAAGDDELVRISTVRRRNLFWGCRLDEDAMAAGRAVSSRLASAAARDELIIGEAEVLAFGGQPQQALALLGRIDASPPRISVLAAIPRAAALATIGRTAEAVATSQRGFTDHLALGDEHAIAPAGTHIVNQAWALVEAGMLAEADELGRTWLDRAVRERRPLGVAWFGIHLARCAITQGRPATARDLADRARGAADAGAHDGLKPIAHSLLAMAHGLLGNATASASHARQIDAGARGFGFFDAELALGRAWATAVAGDWRAARAALVTAGTSAEQADHFPAAAWLLHDALRLDPGDDVAARLGALSAATDSRLIAARAAHARALLSDDPELLSEAADLFEAIGATLLAAEACVAAADSARRRQDQRRATALSLRSSELAARCESAITPALRTAGRPTPLTTREREIAGLAAAGQPSREIAASLFVSVRTVDNHLRRIYEKLGIPGRSGLADALDVDPP